MDVSWFSLFYIHYIYIYAFSRRFYSVYTFFGQYMCSLGVEPTTFALLTQCSTTEPQEHCVNTYFYWLGYDLELQFMQFLLSCIYAFTAL